MSLDVRETYEAQVLCEIENLGVAKGTAFMLLRGPDGKYALAQKVGDLNQMVSAWIDPQVAVDVATRVLGGDKRAVTHPTALQAISVCLVGMIAEGQRLRAGSDPT